MVSSCAADTAKDNIKSFDEISADKAQGELVYIKNNADNGDKNFEDDIYSYWFDKNGYLLSRTLLIRSENENNVNASEALVKATDELSKYTKEQDFSDDGWQITVSKLSKADDRWLIEYAFIDDKNIKTQKHTVTLDKNADASFITFSSEIRSEDAIIIDEKQAVEIAAAAIIEDINLKNGTSLTKEELAANGILYISEKELFAKKGDTLWQITAENVNAVKDEPNAYFVQIDATTGAVLQIDICR